MQIGISERFGDSRQRDIGYFKSFATTMEELGFASLWMPEHVVFFSEYGSNYPYHPDGVPPFGPDIGLYDPLVLTAIGAQVTSTLKFATSILILPQRPALLTAKEVMTLDHGTNGRFIFGVGGGWSSEEYNALGVSFERRGRRFDEYIQAIRAAWTQDVVSYDGDFVSFSKVLLNPKPLTPKGPPIIVGGDSKAAMRRAARFGDGWYGWWVDYNIDKQLEQLQEVLEEENRQDDPSFQLCIGRPARDMTPETVHASLEKAKQYNVKTFILALPIDVATMEKGLRYWADVLELSNKD